LLRVNKSPVHPVPRGSLREVSDPARRAGERIEGSSDMFLR
jgi:hypothetical protein